MTPILQLAVVAVFVAFAALSVARSAWKAWAGKSATGCGSACGKCAPPSSESKVEGRFSLPQI